MQFVIMAGIQLLDYTHGKIKSENQTQIIFHFAKMILELNANDMYFALDKTTLDRSQIYDVLQQWPGYLLKLIF